MNCSTRHLRFLSLLTTMGLCTLFMACPPHAGNDAKVEPKPVKKAATATRGEATLFMMADIRGVLRPCGCTLELRKGGFDRLAPYLATERKAYPKSKLLHAGPLFYEKSHTPKSKYAQRKRQAEVVADVVQRVKMDIAAASAVDIAASEGRYPTLIKAANVQITAANLARSDGQFPFPRFIVEKIGNLRVGVIALASPTEQKGLGAGWKIIEPKQAAKETLALIRSRTDVVVLLSGLGLRDTKRLVRKVPGIHFAVAGGLGEHPVVNDEAEQVGNTRVMQFHREGRFVGRLSLVMRNGSASFVDSSAPSRTELQAMDARINQLETALKHWSKTRKASDPAVASARHTLASLKTERESLGKTRPKPPKEKSYFSFRVTALPWDLPQDPDISTLMKAFDQELKQINLKHAAKLPEAKPGQAVYIGLAKCLECHDETENYWKHDRHSKAWATLVKDNKTFDAECVSCHVTGYGKAGGSVVGKTKDRQDVQCEACHGPGSLHAEAEEGKEASTIVTQPTKAVCVTCHNKHHSPNFDFDKYRAKLIVPGHGKPLK
jgi:hypothetical protein